MKKNLIYTSMLAGMLFLASETANAQWSLTGNAGTNPATHFVGTTDNKALKFRTNNGTRMTISSGGRVGIGNTNPANRLSVFGGTGAADSAIAVISGLVKKTGDYDIIAVEGASQPAPGYGIGVGGTGNFIGCFGNGGTFGIAGIGGLIGVDGEATEAGNTLSLTGVQGLTDGGTVCVGVYGEAINATDNYGVYGQALDTTVADYALVGIGDVFAWRYFIPSDRKLKNNIQNYSGALEKIQQLTASTYRFNQTQGLALPGGSHIGFMADEVEKVFPELIKTGALPAGRTKGERGKYTYHSISDVKVVNYIGLIPVLAEAIKEQKAIVDAKDAQIVNLASQLAAIESRLAALEGTSSAKLSSVSNNEASLEQNNPNPFNQSTVISYTVPKNYSSAQIVITSVDGKAVRTYSISGSGRGSVTINANEIAAGTYTYSLNVNGKVIDSKTMMLTK